MQKVIRRHIYIDVSWCIMISTRLDAFYNRWKNELAYRPMTTRSLCIYTLRVQCCDVSYDFCKKAFVFTSSCLYEGACLYLRYLCLLAHNGVHHILCCDFGLFFFVLCILRCQFLWIVFVLCTLCCQFLWIVFVLCTLCCQFLWIVFVLCTLCCQFLWIVFVLCPLCCQFLWIVFVLCTLCCQFLWIVFVLCTKCCQFLWIVPF